MLDKFQMDKAEALHRSISQSTMFFNYNPDMEYMIKELEEIQNQCEHKFYKGQCLYCYKESK